MRMLFSTRLPSAQTVGRGALSPSVVIAPGQGILYRGKVAKGKLCRDHFEQAVGEALAMLFLRMLPSDQTF